MNYSPETTRAAAAFADAWRSRRRRASASWSPRALTEPLAPPNRLRLRPWASFEGGPVSWTIADLLKIPLDEVPIQEPLEGEVKLAKPINVHEKYGESQFFVLKDGTGEIAVAWQAGKPDVHLAAVEVGDRVRICAELYNKKMVGARKETYTKDGTKKAKIVVYREKLKNLSRTTTPATSTASPSAAQSPQASPSCALLTEAEAIDFYLRVSSTVESNAACVLLEAALNGRLRMPATSHATAAAGSISSSDDAPPYDDSDMPFSLLLPFLLPLLYHLFAGGLA